MKANIVSFNRPLLIHQVSVEEHKHTGDSVSIKTIRWLFPNSISGSASIGIVNFQTEIAPCLATRDRSCVRLCARVLCRLCSRMASAIGAGIKSHSSQSQFLIIPPDANVIDDRNASFVPCIFVRFFSPFLAAMVGPPSLVGSTDGGHLLGHCCVKTFYKELSLLRQAEPVATLVEETTCYEFASASGKVYSKTNCYISYIHWTLQVLILTTFSQ